MTDTMTPGERMRATYEFQQVDHLHRAEFSIWPEAIERWKGEGLPEDWQESNLFMYDPQAVFHSGLGLGWCEPPFLPPFEAKVLEVIGDHEIIQDVAGRHLKVFKGRRHGFMPDYLKHAVTNMADWEAVAPRLDPTVEARWEGLADRVMDARRTADAVDGIMSQYLIGGYMYLRAMIGPEDVLYMFYDQPEVIHAAMQGWLDLMDAGLARVQAVTEIDQIDMAEDICYNHGLLISPDAFREFLMPYYQQLLGNARARQKTPSAQRPVPLRKGDITEDLRARDVPRAKGDRPLGRGGLRPIWLHVDTDGDCRPSIPLYLELGMTRMSPFEVASGCDVVEIGRQYPDLMMSGGIDKRVLAAGKDAIDAHLAHIMPAMVERGGYYPTCDHGVPIEVSFENYLHYRRRVCELDHR